MKLKGESLPILGIATLVTDDCKGLVLNIKETNNTFNYTTKNAVINIIIAMQIAASVAAGS